MIILNAPANAKIRELIAYAGRLNIFPLDLFLRVAEVMTRLEENRLFASDILDILKLIDVMDDHDKVDIRTKVENISLKDYLKIKVYKFKKIEINCGRNTFALGM